MEKKSYLRFALYKIFKKRLLDVRSQEAFFIW